MSRSYKQECDDIETRRVKAIDRACWKMKQAERVHPELARKRMQANKRED